MWHNPRLLNLAANAILALAAAMLVYGGVLMLARSPLFPLRELSISGSRQHISRADLERAVGSYSGNFFGADLAALRLRLESQPWVRRVEVRRLWPDRIEVTLEEHVALARWGDVELVNTHGEAFAGRLASDAAARLPLFVGPARAEGEVTRRYRRFAEILGALGQVPERVVLTPRHAWQLRTNAGLQLELGRDGQEPVESRLARFVASYPETLGRLPQRQGERPEPAARTVDLRYPNGFALRVPEWRG